MTVPTWQQLLDPEWQAQPVPAKPKVCMACNGVGWIGGRRGIMGRQIRCSFCSFGASAFPLKVDIS